MEFKSLKFDAGAVDPDERTFEGYAAAYGNADSDNDIIEQGAFAKSIKEAFPAKSIKVLWQHDARQPIGLPVEMREDSRGLWVKSRISRTAKGCYRHSGVGHSARKFPCLVWSTRQTCH